MVITANEVFLTIRENFWSVKDINITLVGYFHGEVIYKLLLNDVKLKYESV